MSPFLLQISNHANNLPSVTQKAVMTWPFVAIGFIAFVFGPRYTFIISNLTSTGLGIVFCVCVGRRYWKVE